MMKKSKNSRNEVLAVIPARKGSKSIKDKNIRLISGKPLIVYSIEHALKSKMINRVIVSTDSKKYASIAKKFGAEVPFLRPDDIAQDDSTDLDVFLHCLKWLEANEGYLPNVCVHLRPTHPIRKVDDIDKMIKILLQNSEIDSVRSIVRSKEIPFKMWLREENGMIQPVVRTNIKEAYNLPRQKLPVSYYQNASVDVVKASVIRKSKSMNGKKIYGYIMDEFFDIDDLSELKTVRRLMNQ